MVLQTTISPAGSTLQPFVATSCAASEVVSVNIVAAEPAFKDKHDTMKRLTTLLLVSTATSMVGAMLGPILPEMEKEYKDESNIEVKVRMIVALPALVIAFMSAPGGRLIDVIGRTRPLNVFLFVLLISGLAPYFVNDMTLMLTARFVVGIAVSVIMPATGALVVDYYTGDRKSRVLGVQNAVNTAAFSIFIALSGFLVPYGWRLPFLIYGLLVIFIPLSMSLLNEPDRGISSPQIEVEMKSTELADVIVSSTDPSISPQSTTLTEVSSPVSSTAVVTVVQQTESVPADQVVNISWKIVVFFTYFSGFMYNIFSYPIITEMPFYMEQDLAVSNAAQWGGIILGGSSMVNGIVSIKFDWIFKKVKHNHIVMMILVLMGNAAGFGVLASAQSLIVAFGCWIFFSPSGLLLPVCIHWMSCVVSPKNRGIALGGLFCPWMLGQFCGAFFAGYLRQGGLAARQIFLISSIGYCVMTVPLVIQLICVRVKSRKTACSH